MNKLFIIANWKMNPSAKKKAEVLFNNIKKKTKSLKNIEVIICPPFIYLEQLVDSTKKINLGAQDCHWENTGAYTGEVSAKMLKGLGCEYVIIGHSERRNYFKETNEMINKKLLGAFKNNLKPILCVGEKQDQEMGDVVKNQLIRALNKVGRTRIKDLIIAYEPVWAIGTGKSCKPNDAMQASLFIKKILTKNYSRRIAENTPILYGGSVKSDNADLYIKQAEMDGVLVGGASLDADQFSKIIKNCSL